MSLLKNLAERLSGAVSSLGRLPGSQAGQSLIETALILPFLLLLAFDAINFGYFFFTAVNIAASPRQGVEYSIQGFATPSQPSLPPAQPTIGSCPPTLGVCTTNPTPDVCTAAYCDMAGALPSFTTSRVQVCTEALGLNATGIGTAAQIPNCAQFGSGTGTWTPAPDPEAPYFVLQRVDVSYKIVPLIPQFRLPGPGGGMMFSMLPSNLTVHRQVSMRAMN
jgi:TadE-like protein